jgi:hypothetical protein
MFDKDEINLSEGFSFAYFNLLKAIEKEDIETLQ